MSLSLTVDSALLARGDATRIDALSLLVIPDGNTGPRSCRCHRDGRQMRSTLRHHGEYDNDPMSRADAPVSASAPQTKADPVMVSTRTVKM